MTGVETDSSLIVSKDDLIGVSSKVLSSCCFGEKVISGVRGVSVCESDSVKIDVSSAGINIDVSVVMLLLSSLSGS